MNQQKDALLGMRYAINNPQWEYTVVIEQPVNPNVARQKTQ